MIYTMADVWVGLIRGAKRFVGRTDLRGKSFRGANAIRHYWKAFSLRPSPEMARRDM